MREEKEAADSSFTRKEDGDVEASLSSALRRRVGWRRGALRVVEDVEDDKVKESLLAVITEEDCGLAEAEGDGGGELEDITAKEGDKR